MDTPKYADEAAFPKPPTMRLRTGERDMVLLPEQWGLTKRELFAAMAMQAYVQSSAAMSEGEIALCATAMADELLARLAHG